MQKLVKKTALAQRQASRRTKKLITSEKAAQKVRARENAAPARREILQNQRDARRVLREDWELGPLAPRRDLVFNHYGVVKEQARIDWSALELPSPKVLAARCAWAGGSKQLCLAPGDRVVLLDGPDKGKIDTITKIRADAGYVELKNHHRALAASPLNEAVSSSALPMPISQIRLVYPLQDPKTQQIRDVVIDELRPTAPDMRSDNMTLDRWEHGNKWDRVVPSLNLAIPWPEVQAPEYSAMPPDTERARLEQRTFYYGLLSPPMPSVVIDELRGKYSRFRTRHESWYVAKREQQEAVKAAAKVAKSGGEAALYAVPESMQTPTDAFRMSHLEHSKEVEEPVLSDKALARIGRVMAAARVGLLRKSGLRMEMPPRKKEKKMEEEIADKRV